MHTHSTCVPPHGPVPRRTGHNSGARSTRKLSRRVEDTLFVFENYLRGSNVPEASWPNYIMSLLQDKALTAWTSVAVPASTAGLPVTWEMFKQTMLTNFAHPDRQHQAREQLHKIRQRTSQSATDYVRTFNSLVQRAGQPVPSTTDKILFFHSGLLSSFKEKKNQRVAAGARKAPWFDDECRRKRRDFLRSLRDGREELQDTKKECRKHTRRAMKLCFRIQDR